MILLLGATGYIGQAFARELRIRGRCFVPLSREAIDYTRFDVLFDYVRRIRPELIINAAGNAGQPTVDACETARFETLQTNTLLPQIVERVCLATNTPLGHVSSGCIYSGAKVYEMGRMSIERDLNRPAIHQLFETHPENFGGFTEFDEPNFCFRSRPCSFLAGALALAEESLRGGEQTYLWRHRLPFNELDDPSNLLTKLRFYPKVYDQVTSLSHLDDFVQACLDLWENYAPFGIYNITNPGAVTTRQVVDMIQRILKPSRRFEFWVDDEEFYSQGARARRSSCILDVSKLLRAGVKMRPVEEALEDALEKWQPMPPNLRLLETVAEAVAT